MRKLNILLLFIPLAVLAEVLRWPALVIFATSALAVIPLAGLLGEAPEGGDGLVQLFALLVLERRRIMVSSLFVAVQ